MQTGRHRFHNFWKKQPDNNCHLLSLSGLKIRYKCNKNGRQQPERHDQEVKRILSFPGLVILREIDHGSNIDFLLSPMSADELERWWRDQETLEGYSEESAEADKVLSALFKEPLQQKEVRRIECPGEIVEADTPAKRELWLTLYDTEKHYFCHLSGNTDSFLMSPSKIRLSHKGRVIYD